MGMVERRFARSTLTGRVMLSPEPWTVRDGGYPLLLQTGETYNDEPLRDRQHPHDFAMEVGAVYTQAITDGIALQGYAAAAGEPALGPVAFPHRASAAPDPLATLGHHWQDATHISFGVLTAGVVSRYAKLEGSWFNGREPDETRWDFDLQAPDSYAVRLSVAPAPSTTAQVSYGYLSSPETLRPDVSAHRFTGSVSHYAGLAGDRRLLTTAVFGLNREEGEDVSSSGLVEAALLLGANEIFGRAELIQKSGHDLVLDEALEEETFWLGALSLGYLRNLPELGGWLPGLGVRGAMNVVPEGLSATYGSRTVFGAMAYARLTIAPMVHGGH
jgi:hypothetical protein